MAVDRLAALLEFHKEDPKDAFTRFALAQEYTKRGDFLRACKIYESLVASSPAYTGTYYHLGKLYQSLGHDEAAFSIYKRGIAAASREGAHHDLSELRQALNELNDDD